MNGCCEKSKVRIKLFGSTKSVYFSRHLFCVCERSVITYYDFFE